MFACHVCEGTDYDLVDGLYFCKICDTQSEEYCELGTEDVDIRDYLYRLVKDCGMKAPNQDLGRPWTIYEAYQCIILEQCDALISLGAKEDLKDIVYTIWANYLNKLEVAFIRDEKVVPDIVMKSGFGRYRELHGGNLENPSNRRMKYNMKRNEEKTEDADEKEVGNKRKRPESSDSEDENDVTLFAKKIKARKYIKMNPKWMDLEKTSAFCYIGLRFTNPEILLVQFVRWIYEGKVPFMSATHLLNEDMHMSTGDPYLFYASQITVQNLVEVMNKVTRFMCIQNFPTPNIAVMIKELVKRLHLPDELSDVCMEYFKKVPAEIKPTKVYPETELVAMQYIALALKTTFILDDKTEHELSKYSEEVQDVVCSSGRNFFVWNEWMTYQMGRVKTDFDLYLDTLQGRKYKQRHLDKVLRCYKNFHREERRRTKFSDSLMESASDSLTITYTGNVVTKEACDSRDQDDVLLAQRFAGSSLTHILDFDAFASQFKDYVDKSHMHALKKQRRKIYQKLALKNCSSNSERVLSKKLPNSYSWMINFLSDFVGYQTADVETGMTSLETSLRTVDSKEMLHS